MKVIYGLCVGAFALLLFVQGSEWIHWLVESTDSSPLQVLVAVCIVYALLLALPFVPGMELGLFIMAAFGKPGIFGAWLATVVGLNLAYLLGQQLRDHPWVRSLRCRYLKFSRAQRHSPSASAQLFTRVVQYPYLLLGVLFNMPGNAVLGGGGGISLLAGAGSQIRWRYFLAVSAIVTAFVPVLAWFGIVMLDS